MKTLEEDLKTKSWKPLYLLYGEEAYLKKLYKNRLKNTIIDPQDTMNLTVYEGKDISIPALIDQAETMPFFADYRLLLVENSGFFKNACPELAEYIQGMSPQTIMVFVENEVDKRSRMYKTVKARGRIVEMGRQNEKVLQNWVLRFLQKDGIKITKSAMQLFLDRAGDDMENINRELEKLTCYVLEKKEIAAEDVEAVCTVRTENKIFDMINAIAEKNQRKALDLYYDLLALKEAPLRI
ncbi:MAG: DNA polymerase III subunit delta, partial [Lachnospiraceae bacterium]|nr:DNA polymerase III subunit delta [Lachnospiraceae bacterium]